MTSPCDQDEEEHKTTTGKSDAILMTVESHIKQLNFYSKCCRIGHGEIWRSVVSFNLYLMLL